MSNGRHEGRPEQVVLQDRGEPRDTTAQVKPATHQVTEPEGVDFDWIADRVDVAIAEQPAIAVYVNVQGSIVIRQQCLNGDDDPIIRIRPENVGLLIAALRRRTQ